MSINPNDKVRVKLTETGKQLLIEDCDQTNDRLRANPRCMVRARPLSWDSEGWCSGQFHEFLRVLGPHFHMGREMPFTDMEEA